MEKKITLHGKEFVYEDAMYGIIKDYHRGKPHYVPFDMSRLEDMAKHNTRIGTKHVVKVYYGTIDYVLKRPDEFKFSSNENESLERTRQLFQKIYTTLDKTLGSPGTD